MPAKNDAVEMVWLEVNTAVFNQGGIDPGEVMNAVFSISRVNSMSCRIDLDGVGIGSLMFGLPYTGLDLLKGINKSLLALQGMLGVHLWKFSEEDPKAPWCDIDEITQQFEVYSALKVSFDSLARDVGRAIPIGCPGPRICFPAELAKLYIALLETIKRLQEQCPALCNFFSRDDLLSTQKTYFTIFETYVPGFASSDDFMSQPKGGEIDIEALLREFNQLAAEISLRADYAEIHSALEHVVTLVANRFSGERFGSDFPAENANGFLRLFEMLRQYLLKNPGFAEYVDPITVGSYSNLFAERVAGFDSAYVVEAEEDPDGAKVYLALNEFTARLNS